MLNFILGDVHDRQCLQNIFAQYSINTALHFSGSKAVGESVVHPLKYFDNNVTGSLILIEEMARASLKRLVFSSSATVYGDPDSVPISESAPLAVTNPYGRSKLFIEQILRDLSFSDPEW